MLKKFIFLIYCHCVFFSANSYSNENLGHYRALLKAHQFTQLEKEQKELNDAYIRGDISQTEFYPAFDQIFYDRDFDGDWLAEAISHLESRESDSAYRLLNLGIYYAEKGFDIRGGGWISSVSHYTITNMFDCFDISQQYLEQAIKKDHTIIAAYQYLIRMAKHDSGSEIDNYISEVFKLGLQVKSDNYALAITVLYSQLPRWGGSYEQMEATIKSLKPYFEGNPDDYSKLAGIMLVDKISDDMGNRKYGRALKKLEPYQSVLSASLQDYLATIYKNTEQWDECYQHAKLSVSEYPHRGVQGTLGYCASNLGLWEDAKTAFRNYAQLYGVGAWSLYFLAEAYMKTGDYDIAYPLFKESIVKRADYRKYSLKHIKEIEENNPDFTSMDLNTAYQKVGLIDD